MPSVDIVIISVPGTLSQTIPSAPALLKASVESAGFTCKYIDFNIRLYNEDIENIRELEGYFTTGLNITVENQAIQLIETWAKEIIEINPTYLGISVFTYQNRIATKIYCQYIKKNSNIKIILGGQGLADGGILGKMSYCEELYQQKLIDYWIRSEGEYSLVELLKGNIDYPGINSNEFKQIDNLDLIEYPNYDDYNLSFYSFQALPVTTSRGCIRSCSFCDIHDHWKYRYRRGHKVAEEIIMLSKKYNIKNFIFTDSLVNGNLKEFKKLCEILAEYNTTTKDPINWGGQYIVRAANQLTEKYWEILKKSGASNLAIGVETGSDSVRTHMNKRFTNEDLDYTMSMMEKYNITCIFLMIVGYPTETAEDFQQTKDMFTRYQHLAKDIIIETNIGSTLGILPGTPLYNNALMLNIELDSHENNWVAFDNPTLTLEERINRVNELQNHVNSLGFHTSNNYESIMAQITNNLELLNKRNKLKRMIKIKNLNNK